MVRVILLAVICCSIVFNVASSFFGYVSNKPSGYLIDSIVLFVSVILMLFALSYRCFIMCGIVKENVMYQKRLEDFYINFVLGSIAYSILVPGGMQDQEIVLTIFSLIMIPLFLGVHLRERFDSEEDHRE